MIIRSLLDTDLYVFTQMQLAFHWYKDLEVEYAFKCRTPGFDFRPFIERINMEIDGLHGLRFSDLDLSALSRLNLFQNDFIKFLKRFRLNPTIHVTTSVDPETGELTIRIKGRWLDTIAYETPILAIISEVCQGEIDLARGWVNILNTAELLRSRPEMILFEFGTRRRHSRAWQTMVFELLRTSKLMKGSSNVDLATSYGVPAIGTVSHQYFQVMQAMAPDLDTFLEYSMQKWMTEYPNEAKSMLTDIVGYKAFLKALDRNFARHYVTYRHDSGDPYEFGHAVIDRLKQLEIDPKTKILVFSDGLDAQTGIDLHDHFYPLTGVNIAIGTKLTNDFSPDHKALSMVIKMVTCDGRPVAKISDSKGKGMCEDPAYEAMLRAKFGM